MHVYILLYNAGTENEGIHTLQTGDRNVILMFESEDDALRYALLLEAQDFPSPSIEEINSREIEEFCQEAGYEYKIVESGMLEIPPEQNLDNTDWNPDGVYNDDYDYKENMESESEMSKAELDRIRSRLERLL